MDAAWPSQFGETLARFRREHGWSQAALAQSVGVSRQTIIALEQGEREPHLRLAVELAERLNVSLDDLVRPSRQALPMRPDLWVEGTAPPYACPVVWSRIQGALVAATWASLAVPGVVDAWWDPGVGRLSSLSGARRPETVLFAAGCDPFLPWLKGQFETKYPGAALEAIPLSSRRALAALREGTVHVAGTHLYDPDTQRYNQLSGYFPFAVRLLPYLHWEEGRIQHPGTPAVRQWAIREPGSEAAALWERSRPHAVDSAQVLTFSRHAALVDYVSDHPEASGVSIGALGSLRGLSFTPWADEEYSWCYRESDSKSWWLPTFADLPRASLLAKLFAPVPHVELVAP